MPLPPTKEVPGPEHRPHEDKEDRRRRKREAKRQHDLVRQPDAWERYRVLADVIVEGRHLIDLADHKVRFAMVIMGAVNMTLVVVATRTEVASALPAWLYPGMAGLLVPYTAAAFGFLMYAVETLRPRRVWAPGPPAREGTEGTPPVELGILFWEDIARWEPEALRRTWSEVRMSRILAEAVELSRGQALINRAKYSALHRLYLCLHAMVAGAAAFLTVAAYFVLVAR